jgi:N-glycosyltransferase
MHVLCTSLPPWMADLPTDRPLILAAAGTSTHRDAARLAHATVRALAELTCSAVVVTDTGNGAGDVAPPHVRVVDYVPQSLLLPTCDLFVSHGGVSNVRESMQCGVPLGAAVGDLVDLVGR